MSSLEKLKELHGKIKNMPEEEFIKIWNDCKTIGYSDYATLEYWLLKGHLSEEGVEE